MKNNNDNWRDLINEAYQYPEDLSDVEQRFKARLIKEKKNKRVLISSLSAVAASMLFILLVNTNHTFASAVSDIPLIGKLAEYVKFDKGLSNTIKNDYVQEVHLEAWDGQKKLLLPYVIADEKNLVLFYQLPKDYKFADNERIRIELNTIANLTTGEELVEYSYSSGELTKDSIEENYGFLMQDYHFSEGNLPQSISIEVGVYISKVGVTQIDESTDIDAQEANTLDTLGKNIGTFTFNIELAEFKEPITYEINETHTIMGQQVTVKDMKVYPTGTEVTFTFADDNTAWIKGLELEVEQSDGTLLKGKSGLSGSHDIESKWMKVFIESSYFQHPEEQSLVIKGIQLLDKDEEYVIVDLDNKTMMPELNDITLNEVTRRGDQSELVFIAKTNEHFSMFSHQYTDIKGNLYEIKTIRTSITASNIETRFTVEYPADGKVILQRSLTPKLVLDEPINIKLP